MLAAWAATLKITLGIICKRDARAFEIPPAAGSSRHPGLDHQLPPVRPRLRMITRKPRNRGPVGHDLMARRLASQTP